MKGHGIFSCNKSNRTFCSVLIAFWLSLAVLFCIFLIRGVAESTFPLILIIITLFFAFYTWAHTQKRLIINSKKIRQVSFARDLSFNWSEITRVDIGYIRRANLTDKCIIIWGRLNGESMRIILPYYGKEQGKAIVALLMKYLPNDRFADDFYNQVKNNLS